MKRNSSIAWLLPCLACAGASQADLTPLQEEVAALRQAHDADHKRIEALELQTSMQQTEIARLRGGTPGGPDGLPVVHLKPGSMRELPSLPTSTPVREPSAEQLAELQRLPALDFGRGGREEADAVFNAAFEKLKTGELVGAAGMFHAFAQKYPHHPAAGDALLDEGIAYYGLHRYADALQTFDDLSRRYPDGAAAPEALWRSADCYLKLTESDKAQAAYHQLIKRFPTSPEATRAASQLAAMSDPSSNVASTEGEP